MVADKFAFVKYGNHTFHLYFRPPSTDDSAIHSPSGFLDEVDFNSNSYYQIISKGDIED